MSHQISGKSNATKSGHQCRILTSNRTGQDRNSGKQEEEEDVWKQTNERAEDWESSCATEPELRSKEFKEVIAEIMEVVGTPNLSDFFPAIATVDLLGLRRRMGTLLERLHVMFNDAINQRLHGRREAGEPRKNDFLNHLLDAALYENSVAGLDRETFQSMFTDLFTAGSDISSNTVEWAMVELLQNPFSMAKARDELANVIGSRRDVEESEISQLPYLQAVIRETFRLHSTAPLLLPRQAEETVKIMGYTIPKGTRVLINVWAMGGDKDIWPEPAKFLPERFLERTVDFRAGDFELIPFGAGRRICPGIPLAIRMVHLVLGSLLNQFERSLPIEVERNRVDIMAEQFGVTLVKAVPLRAWLHHYELTDNVLVLTPATVSTNIKHGSTSSFITAAALLPRAHFCYYLVCG